MPTNAADATSATSADLALLFGTQTAAPGAIATSALVQAMLDSGHGISDLVFSQADRRRSSNTGS